MPRKRKKHILSKVIALHLLIGVFFAPFSFCAQAANSSIPKIISRAEWGADEAKMNWPTEYAKAEKFVIHHTASSNLVPDPDGSGKYKDMVNNIYIYHNSKKTWNDGNGECTGFGDMGYNYLIDPSGNIYEGRFGGNGVVAGHANGYNTGSIGISVLGRYQDYTNSESENIKSHPVTSAIKKSLENLIGWLAANNNIDLNKISDFRGKKVDGVVGHRDIAPTICPGDELHKQLNSIQSNASIIKKEYNKYSYQIGGDKSIYIIEDGYKTKFSSKDKLPSAYRSRTIKPISKSQLNAYKYKNIIIYPDGSLLQEFNTAKVYYLENGRKRAMEMTGEEFVKMGFATSDIKKVFASDLKIYDNGKIIKYAPDGKLLKDKNGTIFSIENGKKRKFTSAQLFEYLNYKWEDIEEDAYLSFYLENSDMVYPDGTLIREANKHEVYLVKDKQRKKIFSNSLMSVLGYKAEDVLSVTEDEFNHFPEGEMVKYPDNTLVKAEDFPAIYLIENGKRKEFTSATLFEKSGYEWKDVISTTKEEIKNYSLNGRVLYPDGLLVKSINNPAVYLLESSKKRMVMSAVLFEKLGYDWNDVISLSPNEIGEYQTGKILTYPDGTLIKRKGYSAVYKIENGERKEFTSLALFEATNSKWSDIVELDREEFLAYSNGGNLRYPENTLVKEKTGGKIYAIKNGKAEWIKTAEEFIEAGYKWSDVIEISGDEMRLYTIPAAPKIKENAPSTGNSFSESEEVAEGDNNNSNNNSDGNSDETEQDGSSQETGTNGNDGEEPKMRVAIYSSLGENVKITANGNYTVKYYDFNEAISKTETKSANEQTIIQYFNSDSYIKFIPSSENVILKVLTYDDLSWNKAVNDNEFRGNIEINYSKTSKKLWIINELSLEDYANGIAEALNDSPEEYLKSFGAIARTYAMYYIKKGGKHTGEPFHLKNSRNGNGNDQVYKGYNFEMRAPKIVTANESTAGYIINYNDKPIVAAYSSDSGGTTKNACDVLSKTYCGDDYAYLHGGVKDPANTQHEQAKISASHGAGMSAVGAYQMAVDGSLWQEIIKYYYSEVEIEKYY
ncbi:N-acetylmuramoyl-L-alanine amidase [Candidatus Parcubacteria bacterium]|nr:N-acetylmuramoyl-L-alanine amidase [Candidatus Parcubacteria bacterium]